MRRRSLLIAGTLVIAIGAAAYATRDRWMPLDAAAQAPARPQAPAARTVPVEVTKALRKPVPLTVDALGTVTPIASVAIKGRLETEIVGVHFTDGASVKQGDLLFTLDGRTIEAQIAQTEAVLARDQAQLEQAERDVRRYTDLLAKNAGTALNVENAKTQVDMLRATVKADEALLRNLRVQLSYTKITASITGRISAANVKVGNFVRPADLTPLATINQIKPIYVSFAIPQRLLPALNQAMEAGTARAEAVPPGEGEPSVGKIAMKENTVDATTGMMVVRAVMANDDEALWPGTLLTTRLILRIEDAIAIPTAAVQTGQQGTYVFVVREGAARVQPVKVDRTYGAESVISEGLKDGDTVVVDGQLLLGDGTRVAPRAPKVGS